MSENFNTRPEELTAAIGPAICSDCYQVGDDVAIVWEKSGNAENASYTAVDVVGDY